MTEDELKQMEAYARDYDDRMVPACVHGREPIDRCDQCDGSTVLNLVAEVRRLRGLIKSAEWESEWSQSIGGGSCCPWCDSGKGYHPHDVDCPAFTPDGRVK